MPTLTQQISKAEDRAKLARLRTDIERNKALTKFLKRHNQKPKAEYDSLDPRQATKRRAVKIQKKSTDSRIKPRDRNKGVESTRNLQENYAGFKSIIRQFKVGAIGVPGPKLQFREGNESAADWFNTDWAKWCDSVDDSHLSEQLAMVQAAVKRDGDILIVFDDFDRDDGALRYFESTQILSIDQKKWKVSLAALHGCLNDDGTPMLQENGVVKDDRGRVFAYIVTTEHGYTQINPDEMNYFVIPRYDERFNPDGSAKLIKEAWRVNQYRGESDAWTVSAQLQDIYEMIGAELQSAKKAAQTAGWLKVDKDSDAAMTGVIRALEQSGQNTASEIDAIINGDGSNPGAVNTQYEELEGLAGGKWSYLMPGEEPQFLDSPRPNMDVPSFCDWNQVQAGAAFGLGRARSTMKAETSYTAFRGEELMTWESFSWDQKFLERHVLDFLVVKSIRWAVRKGEIQATMMTVNWEKSFSFKWPEMREVDEEKTQRANQLKIKNGLTDYSELLGPDWEKKFQSLSEQLQVAKQLELPLSAFETVSGTVIEDQEGEKSEDMV